MQQEELGIPKLEILIRRTSLTMGYKVWNNSDPVIQNLAAETNLKKETQ